MGWKCQTVFFERCLILPWRKDPPCQVTCLWPMIRMWSPKFKLYGKPMDVKNPCQLPFLRRGVKLMALSMSIWWKPGKNKGVRPTMQRVQVHQIQERSGPIPKTATKVTIPKKQGPAMVTLRLLTPRILQAPFCTWSRKGIPNHHHFQNVGKVGSMLGVYINWWSLGKSYSTSMDPFLLHIWEFLRTWRVASFHTVERTVCSPPRFPHVTFLKIQWPGCPESRLCQVKIILSLFKACPNPKGFLLPLGKGGKLI